MQCKKESVTKLQSELVDICRSNLIKRVSCDQPCSEGYEVENLITNNFIEKGNGFLAERFIKPPVTLSFEFKCEIEIKFIAIFCKVGAQKTTGIELFSQPHLNNCQYESIGSGILQDIKNGFVFHRYSENVKNRFGEQYYFRTFKSSRFITSVNSIKVKIFRTSGTSVPAIGKIEIWGVPSKPVTASTPRFVIHEDQVSSKNTNQPITYSKHSSLDSFTLGTRQCVDSSSFQQEAIIPEDFIDPITCEVMCLPIIMPSGKVIDNSTLESYQKAELCWGRGPSDPFTGIPFSSSNKPVAASDLKARIDKYLSDNSNSTELYRIPRTVGRSYSSVSSHLGQSNCKAIVSKLIDNPTSLCRSPHGCSPITNYINTPAAKRRRVEANTGLNLLDRLSPINENPQNVMCNKSNKLSIFQERMEQSLELALKSTLSKLPKLTADKCSSAGKNSCHICNSCDHLFIISCCHFICRSCLVKSKHKEPNLCLLCNFSYSSNDVQRVHLFN